MKMTFVSFEIDHMDLNINLPVVRHIYESSIKQLEEPVKRLERHPLQMIGDTLKYTYDLDIDVALDTAAHGYMKVAFLDEMTQRNQSIVLKKIEYSITQLLNAQINIMNIV